jgi:hypothetical protein
MEAHMFPFYDMLLCYDSMLLIYENMLWHHVAL